jgi:hypothetical protein
MNDLIAKPDHLGNFPGLAEGLNKALCFFDKIKSFEDVETCLLKGQGLSTNTYRSYLAAVRQLYEYTDGLNPLQIEKGHIEAFYDDLVRKSSRNTASSRIAGLKRFLKGSKK